MAQTELEQIAMAMMMMAEDPERRRTRSSTNHHPPTPQFELTSALPVSRSLRSTTRSSTQQKETTQSRPDQDQEEQVQDLAVEHEEDGDSSIYIGDMHMVKEEAGEDDDEEEEEDFEEKNNYFSINPNLHSLSTPSSPAVSLKSTGSSGGGGGGSGSGGGGANANANSTTSSRRIFTPEFKQTVYEAFTSDPECVGNQRATARKFNIHRRQVQKWIQQISSASARKHSEEDNHQDNGIPTDERTEEQKIVVEDNKNKTDSFYRPPSSSSSSQQLLPNLSRKTLNPAKSNGSVNVKRNRGKMPIVAGKSQILIASQATSARLPSTSPQPPQAQAGGMNFGVKGFMGGLPMDTSSQSSAAAQLHLQLQHLQQKATNGGVRVNGQHKMLELVDELCFLYPAEDFSLLRNAMMKNEVSFTKLSPPRKKAHSSTSSPSTSPPNNDYITQQTLQMIKSQNEYQYLQLLQSAGYPNLSQLQELADASNKYSWLHPFTSAAFGGGGVSQQKMTNSDRKKSNSTNTTNSNENSNTLMNHNFLLPKPPVKNKTVAAVLAATRGMAMTHHNNHHSKMPPPSSAPTYEQRVKKATTTPKRKGGNNDRVIINHEMRGDDDDYLDPTSMLEVVTSKPSPAEDSSGGSEGYGMDLSSPKSNTSTSPSSSSSMLRSKAMNKDYGFLTELGLIPKEILNGHRSPPTSSSSSTAPLEHFVDHVLPPIHRNSTSNLHNGNGGNNESSDRSKHDVLEAFNYDPETAGDARAVARKFGINVRVVQKWIRETPTRTLVNGHGHRHSSPEETHETYHHHYRSNNNIPHHHNPQVNKRKNPNPNQICDFAEEDLDENSPLDMVVPIKKRRVSSSPSPT